MVENIREVMNFQPLFMRRLPVIVQTEAAECGLACLAMIAYYHGYRSDLATLRRRYATSLRGINIARIMEIGASLKLKTRALKAELNALTRLKLPCILHWDMNHFVVLKKANSRRIVIHDPARGENVLSFEEASKHFTGIVLEVEPTPEFELRFEKEHTSLRSLVGNIRGLSGVFGIVFTLALALECFALAGPFYLQWVLDQVLVSYNDSLLTLLTIGFAVLTLFQVAVAVMRSWTVTWFSASLNVQWASNLFIHMMHLPMSWYEKRHIGDVVSRYYSVRTIQQTLTTDFVTAILDGFLTLFTLILIVFYSDTLALVVVGSVAIYAVARVATYRRLRRAQEDQIVYQARQQTELLESIQGALTLKLHNQQAARGARYTNSLVETSNKNIVIQRLNIINKAIDQLVFGLERVLIVWLAARMVLHDNFTVGMLVAAVSYAELFTTRAGRLIDKAVDIFNLGLHTDRVADIALATTERHLDSNYVGPMPEMSIELRNVSFRYGQGEPWILKDCSLRIALGESVAITGPSGSGKTTLAKIILGLLEPEDGEVLCGGMDIRRLGLARYRSRVGAVLQEDCLFEGSIADNIAFFDADATFAKIEEAANTAALNRDILGMPMGYETLVGDMGSCLSGGQQQRLLLARALYRRPELLVLDEATSNLDITREREINSAINQLAITRIVIAHRPETIASTQRVVEMIDGAVQVTKRSGLSGMVLVEAP